jgi:tetratricopeptide (TPR) repeat protein
MKHKDLLEKYSKIETKVLNNQIQEGINELYTLVKGIPKEEIRLQLDKHHETYLNILKYAFTYKQDPEKEKIYNHLVISILELLDEAKEEIITNNHLLTYHRTKREVQRELQNLSSADSDEMLDTLHINKDLENIVSAAFGDDTTTREEYRKSIDRIFNIIWLSDKFSDTHMRIIKKLIHDDDVDWYDKSLFVSSLILSVIRFFDIKKVHLFFDIIEKKQNEVWQRGLVGLFICNLLYNERLEMYPELTERFKSFKGNEDFEKNLELVFIQYLKSRETEKISRKIQEDILPHMMKIKSNLENKLDLDNILSVEHFEDKNPDWKKVFKDTPDLYDKFEEFSMMQMEGSDVFLSAFAMLKRFPFFNKLNNWFLPFYKDNQVLGKIISEESAEFNTEQFISGIERSAFLCNSDKYSFCLNIKYMPQLQKSMMMEMFNMELKAMNELEDEDERLNKNVKNKTVFTQFFQDLYRFFKLHPLKNEFTDVFNLPFHLEEMLIIKHLASRDRILRNVAEFYFEKDYYHEAIHLFDYLNQDLTNYEILEKTGFSYQQLKRYDKALEYYNKAFLINSEKQWLIKKIAFCYRKLKDFEKALEFYRQAEKNASDDLHIQANLGHTNMELGDYDNALKYYFKVEYLAPDNQKIQRPIAWCSFVLGKFDTAQKYFEKIISGEPNANDYLNLGHVQWSLGHVDKTIELYSQALEKADYDFDWFVNELNEDKKYLLAFDIQEIDISLMMDYQRIYGLKDE